MRKAHRSKKAQLDSLATALALNGEAVRTERPKALSIHDLRSIRPKTTTQVVAFEALKNIDHVVLNGTAGVGKSFIGMYFALESLLNKDVQHIKIIRSAVACREQGFIKGSLEEKNAVYEAPYEGLCYELLGRQTAYEHLKKAGQLSFESTGYLRGITLNDTIVILDECQNLSFSEINTVMTRLGENSRIFVCADTAQCDLKRNETGYEKALRVWDSMDDFQVVTFNHDDIVRSKVVKDWIIGVEELG